MATVHLGICSGPRRRRRTQDVEQCLSLVYKWHSVAVFHVLLTVHFGIILVNNQLDAQFFFIRSFQFSTRFEQPRAHHQENQFYQYDIWYMSLCVGDHLVCRSGRNSSDIYQMSYWYNWFSWWWARGCSKHVQNWNERIKRIVYQVGYLQEFCCNVCKSLPILVMCVIT